MRIDVDWSGFIHKETPTGMTVMLFPQNGEAPITQLSNTVTHTYVHLSQGYYNSIVFNQSVTEFGSLQFHNMDNCKSALVMGETAASKWYTKGEERVIVEPEWFGADRIEMAEVTEEMIQQMAQLYTLQQRSTPEYIIATHHPVNVIYTANIKINIEGIHNLKSARGALLGMAEGYRLWADKPLETKATHLVEQWEMQKDPNDITKGNITATIQTFGLPAGHTAQEMDNTLKLSLLLADNKTQLDYNIKVGDKWTITPHDFMTINLNLTLPSPLPDVKPEGGTSGGFDASVEDWGDEIEHNIMM